MMRTICSVLSVLALLGTGCDWMYNSSPAHPDVAGPEEGAVGETLVFITITADPEGDSVAFRYDWVDQYTSAWTDYKASPAADTQVRVFAEAGYYGLHVQVRDQGGRQTRWWPGFIVHIR
jgi:hypothetical protein